MKKDEKKKETGFYRWGFFYVFFLSFLKWLNECCYCAKVNCGVDFDVESANVAGGDVELLFNELTCCTDNDDVNCCVDDETEDDVDDCCDCWLWCCCCCCCCGDGDDDADTLNCWFWCCCCCWVWVCCCNATSGW